MRLRTLFSRALPLLVSLLIFSSPLMAQPTSYTFEPGQARPLAMSLNGQFLFAVNTPGPAPASAQQEEA